jgi:hypothetical protein
VKDPRPALVRTAKTLAGLGLLASGLAVVVLVDGLREIRAKALRSVLPLD